MRPLLLTLLLLPLALAGCHSAGDANGSLRVMLTDAPGDFVTVVLRGEGGAVVLRDKPASVDLLTHQSGHSMPSSGGTPERGGSP